MEDIENTYGKPLALTRDSDLLGQREELAQKLYSLQSDLERPNIFVFMRNLSYEIRHSNFVCWLIDESETHGQKKLFIQSLLSNISIEYHADSTYRVDSEVDINAHVSAVDAKDNNGGRIDIVLESLEHVIIIENKTQSKDSHNQLKKYRIYAEKKYRSKSKTYLYLTLEGSDPKDEEERKHWKNLSYLDIHRTLSAALNEVSCGKTKEYIKDYLDSLGTYWLKISSSSQLASSIIEHYSTEIRELIKGDGEKSAPNIGLALNYLSKNIKKPKGNGFFSVDDIYLNAFLRVINENDCTHTGGNSTYFSFIPNSFNEIDRLCKEIPIAFSLRYLDHKQQLKFDFGIRKYSPNKHSQAYCDFRAYLLDNIKEFEMDDFDKEGSNKAKHDVTIFTKKISFQSELYSDGGIVGEIRDVFEKHITNSVARQSQKVHQLYKRFAEID